MGYAFLKPDSLIKKTDVNGNESILLSALMVTHEIVRLLLDTVFHVVDRLHLRTGDIFLPAL